MISKINSVENRFSAPITIATFRAYAISSGVLSSMAFILNGLLIAILLCKLKFTIERSSSILILNLAISDFIFSLFMLSGSIRKIILETTSIDFFSCQMEGLLSTIFGLNSFLAILLLSVDRYLIVVKGKVPTKKHCLIGIISGFILVIMIGSCSFFIDSRGGFGIQPSGYYCSIDFRSSSLAIRRASYVPFIFFFLCMILVALNYLKIIASIRKTRSNLRKVSEQFEIEANPISSSRKSAECHGSPHLISTIKPQSSQILNKVKNGSNFLFHKNDNPHLENFHTKNARLILKNENRALEIQLTKKAIYTGLFHILSYAPFGLNILFQKIHETEHGIKIFDMVGLYSISLVLMLDPLWNFILDQRIRNALIEIFSRKK